MAELPARVFKVADLAIRWQCTDRHVRNLLDQGKLDGFRLGRSWRITREAVERCERSGSSTTAADGVPSPTSTGEGSEPASDTPPRPKIVTLPNGRRVALGGKPQPQPTTP